MAKRVITLFSLFAFVMGALSLKVYRVEKSSYAQSATLNNTKTITLSEFRGNIYDCNIVPLTNESIEFVAATKPTTRSLDALKNVLTDDEFLDLKEKFALGQPATVKINRKISDCEDIKLIEVKKRYLDNQLAAHLIGHLDSGNLDGATGIEQGYNDWLKQGGGKLSVSFPVDAKGRILTGSDIIVNNLKYNSKRGVVLTLDKNIQSIVETQLDNAQIGNGAAIVLEVQTGEIKAMVSRPSFNPNKLYESMQDENSPLINRCLNPYAVGSVFKVAVVAAALENGISENFSYNCKGKIEIGNIVFHCHNHSGHGVLNLSQAVAQSCNTYFINLSQQLGAQPILDAAEKMGIGQSTEIAQGIVGGAGLLPDLSELNSPAAVANLSFGQGKLMATPLQIAKLFSCIASKGYYREATLYKALIDDDGNLINKFEPKPPTRVLSENIANKINEYLMKTVAEGTGKGAKSEYVVSAGKTATAQTGSYTNGKEMMNAWFAGYFPAESPKYVIVIIKENAISGSYNCAPIYKSIVESMLSIPKN